MKHKLQKSQFSSLIALSIIFLLKTISSNAQINACSNYPVWTPGHAHWANDTMIYNGRIYKSNWWSTQAPAWPAWSDLGPCNNTPQVSISNPLNQSTFNSGDLITIDVTAIDTDGSVDSVKIYDGNTLLTTLNTAPFSFTYSGASDGTHDIYATASDDMGSIGTSTTISFTVGNLTEIVKMNKNSMNIYPNPSEGKVYINNNNTVQNITITNSLGVIVGEFKITNGQNSLHLDYLSNGIYFIHFSSEKQNVVQNIVIQK